MKKFLAILALTTSGAVFAGSATIEGQQMQGTGNTPTLDQRNVNLTVRENITKNFIGDIQLSDTWNNTAKSSAASSFRLEGGLTGQTDPLIAGVKLYTRAAVGQKVTTTANYGYYSIEPGVIAPLGAGFTAKVGYRFRNAFDPSSYSDTTRTIRAGVSYAITDKDAVGVRYDRVRGDAEQNAIAVNYTRSF